MRALALILGVFFLPIPVAASESECETLVRAFYDNGRWLRQEPTAELLWLDGRFGGRGSRPFSETNFDVGQRWYYVKELKNAGTHQVYVKVVRLQLYGMEYTGHYSVTKAQHTCERRGAKTKISRIELLSITALSNPTGRGFNPM